MHEVTFYYTGDSFPAVSVTGSYCAFKCKHCNQRMLQNLYHAPSNREILKLARIFSRRGAKGMLLTGGCNFNAKVPIYRFTKAIKKIKEETRLILLAHTGLVDYDEARLLAEAGLDAVSLDVVASEDVTQQVYGKRIGIESYISSLLALKKAGIGIISPHICVGLNFGRLSHELSSLKAISCISPSEIIIVALMPLRDTPMQGVRVEPSEVSMVVKKARKIFPSKRIVLGCAHSIGRDRALIEELVIDKVDGIAMPTPSTRKLAARLNYKILEQHTCCAIPLLRGSDGED